MWDTKLHISVTKFSMILKKLLIFYKNSRILLKITNIIIFFSEIINKANYGFKSDCWAFGCILYALTTGHPPFEVYFFNIL